MKGYVRSDSLLLVILSAAVLSRHLVGGELMEPWFQKHAHVLPPEVCQAIIQKSEEIGWSKASDSIDYDDSGGTVVWAVDVEENGEIYQESLANLYKPFRPIMDKIVADAKMELLGEDSPPSLDWVFVRKYQANADRRMLSLHNDVNLFTINLALNSDYVGGGLFYQKPDSEWGFDEDTDGVVPDFPDEYQSYDYLVNNVQGGVNTTNIIFPNLETGDVVIYNFTLFHGVAPVEEGTRYSMAFFYDQDHPVAQLNDSRDVMLVLINNFKEPVSLYWINGNFVERTRTLLMEELPQYPSVLKFTANTDDSFEVISIATGNVVDEFSPTDGFKTDDMIVLELNALLPSEKDCLEEPVETEECERVAELADLPGLDPEQQMRQNKIGGDKHHFKLFVEHTDAATQDFLSLVRSGMINEDGDEYEEDDDEYEDDDDEYEEDGQKVYGDEF